MGKLRKYILFITAVLIITIWWTYPLIVSIFSDWTGKNLDSSVPRLAALVSAVAFAGFILSLYFQRQDFKLVTTNNNVKTYLELYQYYISPDFRKKRKIAWAVIRRCVQNEKYCAFVVSETMVSKHLNENRIIGEKIKKAFSNIYLETEIRDMDFVDKESEDRHQLDDVCNFYQLLSLKDVPNDYYKICDFHYDAWRIMLLWYSKQLDKAYKSNPQNKELNNPPTLKSALSILDNKLVDSELTRYDYETVETHPIIQDFKNKLNINGQEEKGSS